MERKLKIKSCIALVIVLILITISTMVTAATGGDYSVGVLLNSNSKLKEGDTVTISLNLTSVNAGNGIDTITAAIEYDENVFEPIKKSNFVSEDWSPSYSATSKMITLIKDSKVTAPETVATINLKVKSSISVESTTITLKEIIASGGRVADGGTGDITVNNAIVTLNKEKDADSNTQQPEPQPKPVNNTTGSGIVGNNDSGNTAKSNNVTTTKRDNTKTTQTALPKAGMAEYIPIAIIVIAIMAIFSYVLYKKLAKDVK